MNTRYEHKPLDLATSQVRLLKIKPANGSLDQRIEGTMQIFDLEALPPYRALSYMWGEPTDHFMIYIDGLALPIRENLHDFLSIFARMPRFNRQYVWVDQICIDQNSGHEKNHQVSLMSTIYSEAEEVLVWLGPTREILDVLRPLYIKSVRPDSWGFEHVYTNAHDGYDEEYEHDDLLKRMSSQMSMLPYWRRVWIRQEIVLAKTCLFVMPGFMVLNMSEVDCILHHVQHPAILPLSRYNDVVGLWRSLPGGGKDMFDLLQLLQDRSVCHHVKDHVFGSQSLWPAQVRIIVDYTRSAVDVLLDACVSFWLFYYRGAKDPDVARIYNSTKYVEATWILLHRCIAYLARSMGRIQDDEVDQAESLLCKRAIKMQKWIPSDLNNDCAKRIRNVLIRSMRQWPPPPSSSRHIWWYLTDLSKSGE